MGLFFLGGGLAAATDPLDEAFNAFWQAEKPKQQKRAIEAVLRLNPEFQTVYQRLRQGRPYSADVARGTVMGSRAQGGQSHPYFLVVPKDYEPARKYMLEVLLHGGVGRPAWEKRDGSWWLGDPAGLDEPGRISLVPAAWNESTWWQRSQSENLMALIGEVKRTYHIDENRIYLLGISDGATGAYFQLARQATPFAAGICLIGHAVVLANAAMGIDGQFFPVNLGSKPLFVVNCEKDFLYPTSQVSPFIQLFRDAGADIEYVEIAGGGHDLKWFSSQEAAIERFREAHVREPHPELVVWETELINRYNRLHWLVIERVGPSSTDLRFPTFNQWQKGEIWPRKGSSGRAGVSRKGNQITVQCSGVRALTLLLSPEIFDFGQPIQVYVNGVKRFSGLVSPSLECLLRWAAKDNDPSQLYGAELKLEIP